MKKESDLEQIRKNLMDQANLQASISYDDFAASRKINKVFLRGTEVNRAALRAKWQKEWAK